MRKGADMFGQRAGKRKAARGGAKNKAGADMFELRAGKMKAARGGAKNKAGAHGCARRKTAVFSSGCF